MRIRNVVHKRLKRLYEDGSHKGLPEPCVDKLRKMFAFLDAMEDAGELRAIPVWRVHELTGAREGTWSLHVTRNWRLTFSIDEAEQEICDVNLEDYH
jgi:toxin HigB-1